MFQVRFDGKKLTPFDLIQAMDKVKWTNNMVQDRNHTIPVLEDHVYEGTLVKEFPQSRTTLPNGRVVLKSAIAYVKLLHNEGTCTECLRLKEEAKEREAREASRKRIHEMLPRMAALAAMQEHLRVVANDGTYSVETSAYNRAPGWREAVIEEFMEDNVKIKIYKEVFHPELEESDLRAQEDRAAFREAYLSQYDD